MVSSVIHHEGEKRRRPMGKLKKAMDVRIYNAPMLQSAFKVLVVLIFVAIVASLGSALFHLSRSGGDSRKMFRSLALRVGLSVGLFILLMVAWAVGLITPHGL
jgi:cytochrome bd-type quinol oxidase subunit 2